MVVEANKLCRVCEQPIFLGVDGKWAWQSKRCHEHWLVYNRSKHKLRYARHTDKERRRNEAYKAANKERLQAARKVAWVEEKTLPPEARPSKKWRKANPEKMRNYWRGARKRALAKDPRHYADAARERRAEAVAAIGRHTKDEWRRLLVEMGARCVYCDVAPSDLTEDHLIALARGGSDFIINIVPACRTCNESKNARDPADFIKSRVADPVRAAMLLNRLEESKKSASTQKPIPKWVKVTDEALIVEAKRLAEQHGALSWKVLKGACYGTTTYHRRIDVTALAAQFGVPWRNERNRPRRDTA